MLETFRAWIYIIFGVVPAVIAWFMCFIFLLFALSGFELRSEARTEAIKAIAWAFLLILLASTGVWGLIRASQQPPCSISSKDVLKTCLLLLVAGSPVIFLAIEEIHKIIKIWQTGYAYTFDFSHVPAIFLSVLVLGYFVEVMIMWLRSRA
jgi:hypothetical protein